MYDSDTKFDLLFGLLHPGCLKSLNGSSLTLVVLEEGRTRVKTERFSDSHLA